MDVLNDPFVRELVRGTRAAHTELLYGAVSDKSTYGTEEHVVRLSRVLTATRSALFVIGDASEENADEVILGAALNVVLDGALTLLDERLHAERDDGTRPVVQH
jgi:hypothetical protein